MTQRRLVDPVFCHEGNHERMLWLGRVWERTLASRSEPDFDGCWRTPPGAAIPTKTVSVRSGADGVAVASMRLGLMTARCSGYSRVNALTKLAETLLVIDDAFGPSQKTGIRVSADGHSLSELG